MSKFKIGDKVEILWENTFYSYKGYISSGFIKEFNGNKIVVDGFWEEYPTFSLIFDKSQLRPCSKFQVGDKIRVRTDLIPGCYYDECFFYEEMSKYRGLGAIITKARDVSKNTFYELNLSEFWSWSEPMLISGWFSEECCDSRIDSSGFYDGYFTTTAITASSECLTTDRLKDYIKSFESTFLHTGNEPLETTKKGGIMAYLQAIPKNIKRFLNANYKSFYQLSWVDEDLDLTDAGAKALINLLLAQYEDKLGEVAKKEVNRIKKLNEK